MKFVKIFCAYCSIWKVCFLIFFKIFLFFMGLRLRWWCWWWKLRRKLAIPTHKHPTRFVFCAVGVVFVLGWGLFWRLFELKSLFLDFGRMEKMVGLSSDRWWYGDGGIVYQKKKDGGMKMEEWSGSHWWREPLQVVSKGALLWSCSDRGSHVCVFNYQNAIKTQFW